MNRNEALVALLQQGYQIRGSHQFGAYALSFLPPGEERELTGLYNNNPVSPSGGMATVAVLPDGQVVEPTEVGSHGTGPIYSGPAWNNLGQPGRVAGPAWLAEILL